MFLFAVTRERVTDINIGADLGLDTVFLFAVTRERVTDCAPAACRGAAEHRFYSLLRESGSLTPPPARRVKSVKSFYSLLRESGSLTSTDTFTGCCSTPFLFAVTRERVTDGAAGRRGPVRRSVSIRCYARAGH